MQRIDLDAAHWSNVLDFYDALLNALGAPDWHGRSIAALVDTMIWSDEINAVKPPYIVHIANARTLPAEVRAELTDVDQALQRARKELRRSEGQDVEVGLEIA